MKILFSHRNFPAQFRNLACHLSQDKSNTVVYLTNRQDNFEIQGINKIIYQLHRGISKDNHLYLKFFEESILHGQGLLREALKLKSQGFIPDIIIGHSWGQSMFLKDIYPNVPYIAHIEWFYNSDNSDIDFILPPDIDHRARTRVKNSHILIDLYTCDMAVTPTKWQLDQIPEEFHKKISVVHEGIDTNYFVPNENAGFSFENLEFTRNDEIITFATRGMEPYRGFPQFMEAASVLLKKRPNCHILIAGDDRVCYGVKPSNGTTFKEMMLEKYDYDLNRLHFTGMLPYQDYLKLLQVSSAHVYLTYPFVLSWSLLEAMSCGCNILASDTMPVQEVIKDGYNGHLFDFFKPEEIVEKTCKILDNRENFSLQRVNARQTIIEKFDLSKMIVKQLALIQECTNKR